MFYNWRKKIQEKRNCKNDLYELSENLQNKLDYLKGKNCSGKCSDYFTWEEFYELVTKTNSLHLFCYNGKEYGIEIGKKKSYFYTENTYEDKIKKENGFCETYENSQELLKNARINELSLKEIWNELEIP